MTLNDVEVQGTGHAHADRRARRSWTSTRAKTRGVGRTGRALLCSFAIISAGACGSSSSDTGGTGSKTLDQLTVQEGTDLCRSGLASVSQADQDKVLCTLQGIQAAAMNGADYKMTLQTCLQQPPHPPCRLNTQALSNPPACASKITVNEVQTCLNDVAAGIGAIAKTISCMDSPSLLQGMQPASCQSLADRCPALFPALAPPM